MPGMTRRDTLAAGSALAAGLALAPVRTLAATGSASLYPSVARMVQGYVSARKLPGMIAALGGGNAAPQVLASGTQAFDSRRAMDLDTLFRVYSMTKPVTGMATMILIDEGRLGLDQPVADFIPEFAEMRVATDPAKSLAARAAASRITIRHLLTHTSGLGYGGLDQGPIGNELVRLGLVPARVSRLPIPFLSSKTATPGLAEFVRRLAEVPLLFEPGARWHYSAGLDVLGLVIQRAAKAKSFEAFLADRLFGPLKMMDSGFTVPAAKLDRLSTNYGVLGGIALPIDKPANSVFADPPAFAMGGSGLVTSPRDYDRFLAMILAGGVGLDGKRVMSERAVAMGTSNLLPPGARTTGTLVAGKGFGAGGQVGLNEDAGIFGWAGAAGTIGFISRKAKVRAALYCQFMPAGAWPTEREFPAAVKADLAAGQRRTAA